MIIKILAAVVGVGASVASLITFLTVRQKMPIKFKKMPVILAYLTESVSYTLLFIWHTAMAVCWYVICVVAAKLTSWLGGLFAFKGYTIPLVFKGLELFFLILGVVTAASYFIIQTFQLVNELWKDQFRKRNQK